MENSAEETCVLSRFSRVRLFATPRTQLLCPWDSAGRNTGVGCHALLQGIFPARGQTCVSSISCIAGRLFTTSATWKPRHAHYSWESLFSWLCRAWGILLPWPGIKPTPRSGGAESEPLGRPGSLRERSSWDGPGHDFRSVFDHGHFGEAQTCSRAVCRGRAGHPARPSVRLSWERGRRCIRESDICHLLI